MTAGFSWTQMFSSVTLMLQLTTAAELIVRDGGEVTLRCENVKADQDKCDRNTWLFSNAAAVTLFERGEFHKDAHTRSDRLSVTADCSLVIKKVTAEDEGRYTCRRFNKSGQGDGPDTAADLCVVNITEQKDDHTVKLNCSMSTNRKCKQYTVTWLYDENKDLMMSQSASSASVTFTTSDYIYTSEKDESLKCRVTSLHKNGTEFTFTIQSPGHKIAWWVFAVAALGLPALMTAVIVAIRWKRAKGNKIQKNENAADPEDAVPYASISYTKNTNSKAQIPGKDDDEEDEGVTYSTVKPPTFSSFGPYTDA